MRAYVSARQCGLCLVLSKETRATTTGCRVDGAMGTPIGAGLAPRWVALPPPGRGSCVPAGVGQMLASEHGRPFEAQSGKIVQRTVERSFAWLAHWGGLARDRGGRLDVSAARLALVGIISGFEALLNPMPVRAPAR